MTTTDWLALGIPWRSEMHSLYETNIVAGSKIVARIYGDGVGEEAAYARLIAAAPDMYLALVGILDCMEPNDIQDHRACKQTAREAIAKAEGRTP
jgi:hypothetical protein